MIRSMLVGATLVVSITAALAQSNIIEQRQKLMKANGAATRTGNQMVKGEVPFDLGKAKEILQVYANTAGKAHEYFPPDSKTGGETTAGPKIWDNQADFRKRFDDWAGDIKQAAAQTKDLESFKAAFGTVTKACGSCHEIYRIKKS